MRAILEEVERAEMDIIFHTSAAPYFTACLNVYDPSNAFHVIVKLYIIYMLHFSALLAE